MIDLILKAIHLSIKGELLFLYFSEKVNDLSHLRYKLLKEVMI